MTVKKTQQIYMVMTMAVVLLLATGCNESNGDDPDEDSDTEDTDQLEDTGSPADTGTGDGSLDTDTQTFEELDEPSVVAKDQTLSGLSTMVAIDSVHSIGPGWLVIHEDDGGSPSDTIGFVQVADGQTESIDVALERPTTDGETLHAMLHADDGTVGEFEFPTFDAPAEDSANDIVVDPFQVTVPQGTPAVRLTVNNVGATAYDFVSVVPETFADTIGAQSNNQTLSLFTSYRYEVINQASVTHPFEVILMSSAGPANDTILLSQESGGSLESDGAIDWFDDGSQTIRFTVTANLDDPTTGYRCSIHVASMRGSIALLNP